MSQQLSFGFTDTIIHIPISEVAIQLNVSVATIRNWIKEGLLESKSKGYILQSSIDNFIQNHIGTHKLNSRANKQQKNTHDHQSLTSEIAIAISSNYEGNELSIMYENSLSESYKNKEGIYYTPTYITSDMMKYIIGDVSNKTFLEPCCGCGNFVVEAIKKGFSPENIYAFDTDENAVEITKKRIFDLTGYKSEKIVCADFLSFAKQTNQKFDYIYTNPPWGKKIKKVEKDRLSKLFNTGNSTDTCAIVFFACIPLLNTNGQLGFLLPEAFFNISNFEDVRKKALSLKIEGLIDYEKPFKGLLTKAQAIIVSNNQTNNDTNVINCEIFNKNKFIRVQKSFLNTPKHILNFYTNQEDADVISYIYTQPNITLKDNAKWGLGIVTGDNDKFCSSTPKEGYIPIYRGKDILKNDIKEPSLFIKDSLDICQQVAPIELYEAKEKIIYRFISNNLIFFYDNQQRYILNSANMIILNEDFPISVLELVKFFNSEIINWLFSRIFNTHKILRGDLELIPIPINYFYSHKEFNEFEFLKYLNIEYNNGTYRLKE